MAQTILAVYVGATGVRSDNLWGSEVKASESNTGGRVDERVGHTPIGVLASTLTGSDTSGGNLQLGVITSGSSIGELVLTSKAFWRKTKRAVEHFS